MLPELQIFLSKRILRCILNQELPTLIKHFQEHFLLLAVFLQRCASKLILTLRIDNLLNLTWVFILSSLEHLLFNGERSVRWEQLWHDFVKNETYKFPNPEHIIFRTDCCKQMFQLIPECFYKVVHQIKVVLRSAALIK